MGYNPIRRHLVVPFGVKQGEHMDKSTRQVIGKVREVIQEYRDGFQTFETSLREIDNFLAIVSMQKTVLPAERLAWESREVDDWLPTPQSSEPEKPPF